MTTPEHYQRLEQLFQLACATPAEERSGVLDRLCAGEPALRSELEAMLKSDENPLSLFEHPLFHVVERLTGNATRVSLRARDSDPSPVVNTSSDEKRAEPRGRGHYQLLGEIARGGMGVVLHGHDSDLGRDIALKVLHKDLSGRPDVLQRFMEEAQIGGQLQHPGIVPVYELGLMADRRPYFTMKLVKGRTLAALLAQREADDTHRLLGVFESVCQTLAYAHSRGVVHRDLKPSNVMVGSFGEVHVVDWGLAKVLASGGTSDEKRQQRSQRETPAVSTVRSEGSGSGSHSQIGSVMGTPAYMPPEQARGEVELLDERSDVFALGAILCEILTGMPPYTGKRELVLEQAARAHLDGAFERLNDCRADPDLIALCRKCLAPEQSARPRNSEVLVLELQAHRSSVEQRARAAQIEAAEARIKAEEEKRARKLTLGLAACVLLTVLTVGGGWLVVAEQRATRERKANTQVAAALEEATLLRGQQNWSEALAAAQRAEVLAASTDASAELAARVAREVEELRSAADDAARVERQARENAGVLSALQEVREPEGPAFFYADWGRVDRDFAAVCGRIGLDLDGSPPADAAQCLAARGLGAEFAAILDEWSMIRISAGNAEGARQLHEVARALDPDVQRDAVFAAIQARDPKALEQLAQAAKLPALPGGALRTLGAGLQMLESNDEAVRVLGVAVDRYPSDFPLRMEYAHALSRKPALHAESIQQYTAAIALRPESIEAWHETARTLEEFREFAKEARLLRKALDRWPRETHLLHHLAKGLYFSNDDRAAEETCRKIIGIEANSPGAFDILGMCLRAKNDLDGAIENYRRAVQLDPKFAAAWADLGLALCERGDFDGAESSLRTAVELAPKYPYAHAYLGRTLGRKGKFPEALECTAKALTLDPKSAEYHTIRGDVLRWSGEIDGAIEQYQAAIDLNPRSASAHNNLGNALRLKGNLDGATKQYLESLALDADSSEVYVNLAAVLLATGEVERAIEYLSTATQVDPKSVAAHLQLGVALCTTGNFEKAIASLERALALDSNNVDARAWLGNIYTRQGDIAKAIRIWRELSALAPNSMQAHANLAWMLATAEPAELRDPDEAVLHARRALDLGENDPNNWQNLGVALYVQGDFVAALTALQRDAELESDPVQVSLCSLFLGLTRQHMSDPDGARKGLRDVEPRFDLLAASFPEVRRFVAEARALLEQPER